jgi:ATP-binding cassette subfamily B protein RaxB
VAFATWGEVNRKARLSGVVVPSQDEATSHLDLVNEQRVAHALAQMPLTLILIAHRPETIAHAQRVVQVRRGLVVEGGASLSQG